MSAEVTRQHRLNAYRALRNLDEPPIGSGAAAWVENGKTLVHSQWERVAQSLADTEAAALATIPTLYEAHGTVVGGPRPCDATGTGCLLCDMVQTIGEHTEGCAALASRPAVEWIAVSERMPDFMVDVLLFGDDQACYVGYANHQGWTVFGYHESETEDLGITHWMPLPAPPTESRKL